MPHFDLPPARAYLVALSGGADSRLLLELAVRAVSARHPGRPVGEVVRAAHLNHGIRGEEADRDEAFCRSVAASLGVPLTVEHIHIPTLAAEHGQSEETAAREARYAFFTRTMQAENIPLLLTAHTADDQLETLLQHLLRGSGTKGMGGIPLMRPLGDILPDGTPLTVARPLLGWTKREILNACRELGCDYVTDSTNAEGICTRNRLRHEVIPALEAIAGEGVPQRTALRLSEAAREDDEALTAMAKDRYAAWGSPLPTAAVTAEPPAISKRMILLAYADFLPSADPGRSLSAYHLDALLYLCRSGTEGSISDRLASGAYAEVQNGCLVFRLSAKTQPLPSPKASSLSEGEWIWDAGNGEHPAIRILVETGIAPMPPQAGTAIFASAVFPAEKIPLPLGARPRAAGDIIFSHGLHKKLKKLICDSHIDPRLRDRLPLICLPDGTPLWFPGVAFSDGFPAPAEGPALRITVILSSPSNFP